jgi:hypothetical protein
MRPAVFLVLSAAVLSAGLSACSSGPDRTGQSTEGFYAASQNDVWEVAERQLNRQGFAVDSESSSKTNGTMLSRWSINLHPFSHHGYRDQATVTIRPVASRASYYTVEVNVVRQINKNLKEPTNPARVDWDTGARVPEVERILKNDIELFFLGHDVSDEFRAKWGMAPARPRIPAPGMQDSSTSERPR